MRQVPTVLTIILTYRTPDLTLKAATVALREMAGVSGEILVIDNGSGDGSYERLMEESHLRGWRDGGRVRVVSSGRNGGFGSGVNFGLRMGMAECTPNPLAS